ncbi:MAG: hypothetical protein ACHQ5A_05605 [Opitutales bacterium]
MNNDEAKFILRAYRPNGRDAQDATFTAALRQSRGDPDLGAWFERERNHDQAVAAKLAEVAPPAGLREAILAGGQVSRGRAQPKLKRVTFWLALAAGLTLLISLDGVWQGRRSAAEAARFAEFAANDVLHGRHQEAHGDVLTGLVKRLGSAEVKLPGALAINLDELKANGCRTIKFAGRDVLEVCFARHGQMFHLYVLPRGLAPGPAIATKPELLASDGTAVAVWSDGKYDFAVVSPTGMDALKRLAG